MPLNRKLVEATANLIGLWDILPYGFVTNGAGQLFCSLFDGKFCSLLMGYIADADPLIDNTARFDMYMSNLPGGSGYLDTIHYAQLMNLETQTFRRFDHGENGNKAKYGQSSPPNYNLKNLNFPLAMMSGSKDMQADPEDVKWTIEQLKDIIIFQHEYYMGHMSFAIGKDMSWFSVDCMAILNHYNDKCQPSTFSSKFAVGNEKCT